MRRRDVSFSCLSPLNQYYRATQLIVSITLLTLGSRRQFFRCDQDLGIVLKSALGSFSAAASGCTSNDLHTGWSSPWSAAHPHEGLSFSPSFRRNQVRHRGAESDRIMMSQSIALAAKCNSHLESTTMGIEAPVMECPV